MKPLEDGNKFKAYLLKPFYSLIKTLQSIIISDYIRLNISFGFLNNKITEY